MTTADGGALLCLRSAIEGSWKRMKAGEVVLKAI